MMFVMILENKKRKEIFWFYGITTIGGKAFLKGKLSIQITYTSAVVSELGPACPLNCHPIATSPLASAGKPAFFRGTENVTLVLTVFSNPPPTAISPSSHRTILLKNKFGFRASVLDNVYVLISTAGPVGP